MKIGKIRKFLSLIFLFALITVLFNRLCYAISGEFCKAEFINPITEIRWEGIFPIEIAGVEIKGISSRDPASEGLETNPDHLDSVVCICKEGGKFRIGITVSYWEPARVIESTKIPLCFPTLGIKLSEPKKGANLKGRAFTTIITDETISSNSHYYFFNVLDIIDLFIDLPCSRHEGFDIAYISEIDPLWNNEVLGFILNPEAVLFGNPAAQLACAADSVAALTSYPIDSLFWCVGSWGSAYPLAGTSKTHDQIQHSALIAARTIYREARLGMLWDPGIDECYAQLTPVWKKTNYKIHMLRPKKGPLLPLGRSQIIWESGKNPPLGTGKNSPDNFSYMMFRRVKCCLGKTFGPQQ